MDLKELIRQLIPFFDFDSLEWFHVAAREASMAPGDFFNLCILTCIYIKWINCVSPLIIDQSSCATACIL